MKKTDVIFIVCGVSTVLTALRPGAQWNLKGEEYSGIVWLDKIQTQPAEADVTKAISACQAKEAADATMKAQAVADAKDTTKTPDVRLNALVTAIDLK